MRQISLAIDQLLNVLPNALSWLFPQIEKGMADETISARAWRRGRDNERWDRFRRFVDALFFWQEQHCFNSYISEWERKQLPEEYRSGTIR